MAQYFVSPVGEGDVIYHVDYDKFFLVEAVEPLGLLEKDFGAISAGSKLEKQEFSELYPPRGFAIFVRILPVTANLAVYIRVFRETMRGALKNATFYLTSWVTDNVEYHSLGEVWVFWDQKFYLDLEDLSGAGLSESKVRAVGYLYRLREISEEEVGDRRVVRVRVQPIATGATT